MRNAKLLSTLLATVLLCASVIGALFIGADAANPYELNVGGSGEFSTVAQALASIAEADLSGYDSVTVKVNADVTETTSEGVLFDCPTIWKEMGVMMPITVTGEGSLSFPEKKFASANDITFKELDMPISTTDVLLFAGNGKLTFDRCDFGTGYTFRIFADNFTEEVYANWDEADYHAMKDEDGHIKGVTTIKNGAYTSNTGSTEKRCVAATGSNVDYEATVGSVKISANNTKAELILENVTTAFPNARTGSNPVAETILTVKNCAVTGYRASGHESTSKVFSGDLTVNIIGGTYSGFGRLLNGCTISADTAADKAPGAGNGDVSVTVDGAKPINSFKTSSSNFIQSTWGTVSIAGDLNLTWKNLEFSRAFLAHNSAGVTVGQDYNLTIDGLETGAIYGYFAEIGGDVTQNVKGLNIIQNSYNTLAFLDCPKFGGDITNTFTDCTIGYDNTSYYYFYLGSRITSQGVENITNTLKNVDITTTNIVFSCANYKGDVNGNITNTVDADCTFSGGFIGGNYNGSVYGNISNTIEGGVFKHSNDKDDKQTHAAFTGGIYTNGNITGKITNHIKGGTFDKCKNGYSAYMGAHQTSSHTLEGGIEAVIDGGEFAGYVFGGNRGQTAISNSVEGAPAIKITVNGGTFHGLWANKGQVNGDVVTTINGGNFKAYSGKYPYVFSGGSYRDDSVHVAGDTITEIYGGTFEDGVVAGVVNRAEDVENVFSGKAILKIYGGTFEGSIYGNSYRGFGKKIYTSGELTIDTTVSDADPLLIMGAVGAPANEAAGYENDTFTVSVKAPSTGAVIKIGANTDIVADTFEGALTLLQTEGWLGHDYFASPATADLTVEEANGIYGIYELTESDAILLKGGYEIGGATLIFEDRVGIRVLLDPEMTAIYTDGFKYSVAKDGEAAFFEGTQLEKWTDSASGTVYDSFVICGIGLRDFGAEFTVEITGAEPITFSVNSLATLAQSTWTGDWKAFAQAICNLHGVYSDAEGIHDESVYALQAVTQELALSRNETAVASGSVTLLMSDAVGMKLSLNLSEAYTAGTLTATVNGYSIPSAVVVDGTNVTVTFFVRANAMTDAFTLQLLDGENEIFSMTASIEKLASDLANSAGNENQENAQALLYYIQKGAAVA